MNPVNAILMGMLVALACKRKNAVDPLGNWRLVAGAVGAVFPYSEALLALIGPGVLAQGMRGLTWSLPLMPIYAVMLAGLVGLFARRSWEEVFVPVCGGLGAAWVLALLTEPGIFPLALFVNWRVGLEVLGQFDLILMGFCVVGIGMGMAFRIHDRDLARLTLLCLLGYLAAVGFWSWQARAFGERYARLQELPHAAVDVEPQALSPLNWRVIVAEPNGRVHEALITLGHATADRLYDGQGDDPYHVRDEAVWKIHRRYGEMNVPEDVQRQARLAWYGWQGTPFGWLGRYAVFERMYVAQEVGIGVECVGFKDLRATGKVTRARGTFVVCPWRGRVRVFQPTGAVDKQGNWLGMYELVAYQGVRP